MGLFFLFWLQKDFFQSYPIIVRKKFCIEKLRLERQILSLTNFYFGFLRRNNIFIIYKLRGRRRLAQSNSCNYAVILGFFHFIQFFYFCFSIYNSLLRYLSCFAQRQKVFFQSHPIKERKIFCSRFVSEFAENGYNHKPHSTRY